MRAIIAARNASIQFIRQAIKYQAMLQAIDILFAVFAVSRYIRIRSLGVKSMRKISEDRKEALKYKKALKKLTDNVMLFIDELDKIMKNPSSISRGKKVAWLSNSLDMINDHVRYTDLNVDFKRDNKHKIIAKLREKHG